MDERDLKWTYFPILGTIIGEMLLFYGKILPGLFIHSGNLIIIILLIIFGGLKLETKNVLQGLTLLIISRIISFSTPQFFGLHTHYLLIYGIMIIPFSSFIRNIRNHKTGSYNYLPIIILITTIIFMISNFVSDIKIISGNLEEEFMAITLIILLSISFLMEGTQYWNQYNSNIIKTSYIPMLLMFIAIIILKIRLMI